MLENRILDPFTVMLIPIPRLLIPDPGAVIPDPTPFFTVDPWSHKPCYYPEIMHLLMRHLHCLIVAHFSFKDGNISFYSACVPFYAGLVWWCSYFMKVSFFDGLILWRSHFMMILFMKVSFYDDLILYEGHILWWTYFMKVSFYDGLILWRSHFMIVLFYEGLTGITNTGQKNGFTWVYSKLGANHLQMPHLLNFSQFCLMT